MRAEVVTDTEEIAGLADYYPSSGYRGWVTPRPGFLDQCIARYPQSTSAAPLNRETYKPIAYSLSPHQTDRLPLEVFDVTDLTGKSIAFHQKELQMLSGLTRHAVVGWAQRQDVIKRFGAKRLERFIAGHRNETGEDHICVVPIPSIDNEWNADGRFRRVAIVGNGIQDDQDRAALDGLFQELEGAFLIDHGRKVGQLWTRPLQSLGGMEALLGARESRVFRSITPVILKRNPRNSRPISRTSFEFNYVVLGWHLFVYLFSPG
jgi:CRISPR-associated protein Csb2